MLKFKIKIVYIAISKKSGDEIVMSSDFNKGDEYICKCCSSDVIAHCGQKKKWHFQHKSLNVCDLSKKQSSSNSMSEFHRRFQWEFFKRGAELEVRYEKNIADVVFKNRVFEIQNSPISYKCVKERSDNYTEHTSHSPIWILNEDAQNVKNYPNDLLKVSVGSKSIKIFFKGVYVLVKTKDPISKTIFLCQDLSKISNLIEKKADYLANKIIKDFYTPAYKFDENGAIEESRLNSIFKNMVSGKERTERYIKKEAVFEKHRTLILKKRRGILNEKNMKEYIKNFRKIYNKKGEVIFSGVSLMGANLKGANMKGFDLQGVDLSGANLSFVDLSGADLRGADLSDANLYEADLSGALLSDANLKNVVARHADFSEAELYRANLEGADFRDADFSEAILRDADFSGADLRGADFWQSSLSDANFSEANLEGVDMSMAFNYRGNRYK